MLDFQKILHFRFVRYLILGVASMVVEMALLIVLVELLSVPYLTSNIFAFLVVNFVNYIISRKWVFESSGVKRRYEFPTFLFFVTCGLAINQFALWVIVETWGIDYRIAKLIATTLVVGWNFLTRKYLVFGILSKFVKVKTL